MKKNRLLALIAIIILVSAFFVFVKEREWVGGVNLNPYQIDEIELVTFDGDYNSQIGVQIHDKKWIREILNELKNSTFIKEAFPPDELDGERYVLLARKGDAILLHADIYIGNGQQQDQIITSSRFHYQLPNSIKDLFYMTPPELAEKSNKVERWINWGQFVIIDGEPYYGNYVGKGWSEHMTSPVFTIENHISSPTILSIHEDEQALFRDKAASLPVGTEIYQVDGYYFYPSNKEKDSWHVLLPKGYSTHWLGLDEENKVQRWEGAEEEYFMIKMDEEHYKVYSALDPATQGECLLDWNEESEKFVSRCSDVTYNLNGESNQVGSSNMRELSNFKWNNVLFIENE